MVTAKLNLTQQNVCNSYYNRRWNNDYRGNEEEENENENIEIDTVSDSNFEFRENNLQWERWKKYRNKKRKGEQRFTTDSDDEVNDFGYPINKCMFPQMKKGFKRPKTITTLLKISQNKFIASYYRNAIKLWKY